MTRSRNERRERGLTMTELTMVVSVMSIMMIMTTESLSTLSSVRVEQRAHFQIGDVADRIGRRLEHDIDFAARVFGAGAGDLDYLRAMAVGPGLLAAGNRLPLLTDRGYFAADPAGTAETGNVLFTATRGPRIEIELDTGERRLVQLLHFCVSAPVETDHQLDVLRWVSAPVVDYWDLMEIPAASRGDAVQRLHEHGVRYAWESQCDRGQGLFELRADGALELLDPEAQVTGREDPIDSRPFHARRMRLATASLPGTPVPAYASARSGFAGAFEIKIDGASSGKLVMLRFVVVSTGAGKRPVWTEIHRLVDTSG